MNLFDDIDLFSGGQRHKKIFELPDTDLSLFEGFFPKDAADQYYQNILKNTPWRELDWTLYGNTHKAPRMVAWYEDPTNLGVDAANAWTPEMLEIKAAVEAETNFTFNSVLLNLYRNGSDGVGWHSDRKKNFGENQVIASVSFGQSRPFRLRHKFDKTLPVVEIPLHHGSLLLMAGTTQSYWEHHIPKSAKIMLPRINLTFRRIQRQIGTKTDILLQG